MSEVIKKVSIIASKGSLDGIYPALILANGARAEGIEASVFFTFFGFAALHKKLQAGLKIGTVGNPALSMAMPLLGLPITFPFPSWLGVLPGVSAFASWIMKRRIRQLGIPRVPEFLKLIHDSGGKIYACRASLEMFGISRDELVPEVDSVLTVGDFYEKSAGAEIIFI